MNWLKKLLGGGRTRCVASSSLPAWMALDTGKQVALSMSLYGKDVIATPIANTNSMIPTMDANCILLLEKCPYEDITEGDIVTYRATPALWNNNSHLVCHRANERTKNGWWTLGDGCTRMDPEVVTPENFDRRVCGIIYGHREADTDN